MKPIINEYPLTHYRQQVKIMAEFTDKYCHDLDGILTGNFTGFYNAVCRMPYIEDQNDTEVIARPRYIMKMTGADCKKKSILIASFCKINQIPVRFVVMSSRKDLAPHHIYTEIFNGSRWIAADATYNGNKLGSRESETYREVFQW